jgi:hypothetical protein
MNQTSGRLSPVRLLLGVVLGSLVSAFWLASGLFFYFFEWSLRELAVAIAVFFGMVAASFIFLGIPAYVVGCRLSSNSLGLGTGFGLLLGLAGGLEFGSGGATEDLIPTTLIFGLSGSVAALVFLFVVGRRRIDL